MNWHQASKTSWQEGWSDDFGDVQRYIYDAYACRVYITKLANEKITVSTTMYHQQFGNYMWADFWRFNVDEEAKARTCYSKVTDAVKEVFQKFQANDIPNNLLHSYLREAVRFIDIEQKPPSRIPSVDWATKIDGVADWRSSIYGTRYPKSDGF